MGNYCFFQHMMSIRVGGTGNLGIFPPGNVYL
jgi:hypothetical protein